jgi:hypothetical protein
MDRSADMPCQVARHASFSGFMGQNGLVSLFDPRAVDKPKAREFADVLVLLWRRWRRRSQVEAASGRKRRRRSLRTFMVPDRPSSRRASLVDVPIEMPLSRHSASDRL